MNFIKTYYELSIAGIIIYLNIFLFQVFNSVYFAILFAIFSILMTSSVIITPILLKERVNKFKIFIDYFYIIFSITTLLLILSFYLLRSVI